MSECPDSASLLALLSHEALDATVLAHARVCPRCRSTLTRLGGVLQIASALEEVRDEPVAPLPPELNARLRRITTAAWEAHAAGLARLVPTWVAARATNTLAQRLARREQAAVHALWLNPTTGRGRVMPFYVWLAGGATEVRPQHSVSPTLRAVVDAGVATAYAALGKLGFDEPALRQTALEWSLDPQDVPEEPESLGLGVSLATAAVLTGARLDPSLVACGAVSGSGREADRLREKWARLRSAGRFRTVLVPSGTAEALPTEARYDTRLRAVEAPSVEAALLDVLGPVLGVTADWWQRWADRKPDDEGLELWVGPADNPEASARDSWTMGERVRLCVRSSRDCYLSLFNVGPTGNVTILLPNAHRQNVLVRAGERFTFPSQLDSVQFELLGPPGRERLLALASSRPLRLTPQDLGQPDGLVCARPSTRRLFLIEEVLRHEAIASATTEFTVEPAVRATLRSVTRAVPALAEFAPFDLD
jgi:hypothetical protein